MLIAQKRKRSKAEKDRPEAEALESAHVCFWTREVTEMGFTATSFLCSPQRTKVSALFKSAELTSTGIRTLIFWFVFPNTSYKVGCFDLSVLRFFSLGQVNMVSPT